MLNLDPLLCHVDWGALMLKIKDLPCRQMLRPDPLEPFALGPRAALAVSRARWPLDDDMMTGVK